MKNTMAKMTMMKTTAGFILLLDEDARFMWGQTQLFLVVRRTTTRRRTRRRRRWGNNSGAFDSIIIGMANLRVNPIHTTRI